MSGAKHTPGPWEVYEKQIARKAPAKGHSIQRCIGTAYEHPQLRAPAPVVTLAFGLVERPYISISEANARLIAAAPEMLAVVEIIADRKCENYGHITCLDPLPGALPDPSPCPPCRARAAIARATGGAA